MFLFFFLYHLLSLVWLAFGLNIFSNFSEGINDSFLKFLSPCVVCRFDLCLLWQFLRCLLIFTRVALENGKLCVYVGLDDSGPYWTSGFLSLSTIDISGWTVCCECCPVNCRMFSSIRIVFPTPIMMIRNVPDTARCSLGAASAFAPSTPIWEPLL